MATASNTCRLIAEKELIPHVLSTDSSTAHSSEDHWMLEKKETSQSLQPSSLSSRLKILSFSEEVWTVYNGQAEERNTTIPLFRFIFVCRRIQICMKHFSSALFSHELFKKFYLMLEYNKFTMVNLFQVYFLEAQLIKNPPAMQETWVRSLGWKDPLEKGTGYPLRCPGLENSMDGVVHGATKSRTWLSPFFNCTAKWFN